SNLSLGIRTLTLTDANGCKNFPQPYIPGPQPITINITHHANASVAGATDGAVTIEAGGGTPPYTYQWSNGATTTELTGLAPGNYTITVTDSKGCEGNTEVGISAPDGQTLAVTLAESTAISCYGGSDGTARLVPTGGT